MIPGTLQRVSQKARKEPIYCAEKYVGMEKYTETMGDGFSDRCSVLSLSAYAYQEGVPLVPGRLNGIGHLGDCL